MADSLTENSHGARAEPVIPAKAEIQGAEIRAPALGPRFRGGDDKWLVISGSFRSDTEAERLRQSLLPDAGRGDLLKTIIDRVELRPNGLRMMQASPPLLRRPG